MKLRDIGEFGLIEKIAKATKVSSSVIKGIGDDCAVLKYQKDKYLLVTTDMLIEGVHFSKNQATPQQIGHKAMAVNLSDIAACGGIGKWAVISAGLPKDTDLGFVEKLYSGIKKIASKFDIDIVGGDTNLSDRIVISIALIGEANKKNLLLRSGAKAGDAIFITGRLLRRPDDLGFMPKIEEANFLANNFKINSMIDISDGLLSDLGHILQESKVGACLYESLIPHEGDSIMEALSSGEQFELLFTAEGKYTKRLLFKARMKKIKITAIGEVTDNKGKIIFVHRNGNKKEVKPKGYRHF